MIKTIINDCYKPITAYVGSKQVWQNEWTPTQLFKNGEQGVWYDPSDLSTMFQDVDGLEPVTKDGDPVALIRDKSGNGIHATQTVSTARPTYKTDGSLHWLEFDGVDDALSLPYNWITYINGFASVKNYVRDTLFAVTKDNFRYGIRNLEIENIIVSGNYNGSSYVNPKEYDIDGEKNHLIEFENDSLGLNELKINSMIATSGSNTPSTSKSLGMSIGSMTNLDIGVNGIFHMKEFILLNHPLQEDVRNKVTGYLNRKSGVTL